MGMLKTLKDSVFADSIGKNKAGNYVFRKSYFYTHGYNDAKFGQDISVQLTKANIAHTVVNTGNHYANFRGGASIAQGSHFWAEVKIEEPTTRVGGFSEKFSRLDNLYQD